MKNVWNQRRKRRLSAVVLLAVCICCTGCVGADGPVKFFVFGEISADEKTTEEKTVVLPETAAPDTAAPETAAPDTAAEEDGTPHTQANTDTSPSAEIIANPPLYDASPTRKPLFIDADGTVHGPQIGTTESGTPVYDYEIEDSLAQAPQGWLDFTYAGRKQSYLSPDGVWLFRDEDGTIHGPQIGTTESGTPMFDYEFDTSQIPQEWKNW